ncbi:MAG TPA: hypothetical protein VKU00_03915 [Chthonomonadaceae bacterium]|nr:hypothetical protein [Chthonomonadaceae bacterium]
MYNALQRALGRLDAGQIEKAFEAAVSRGDAQMMRLWMQAAGMDLTERPQVPAGPGAEIIVIRPHPMTLSAEEEQTVQQMISDLSPSGASSSS